MSEKIDIFTLLPADAPFFIVDTSVNAVPLQRPYSLARKMVAAGALSTFQPGDNFTVISAGFIFPESFNLASSPANLKQSSPAINLGVQSTNLAHLGIDYFPNFGLSGIQVPLENYELPLGVYVDIYNLGSPDYYYRTDSFNLFGTLRGLDENYSIPNNYNPTTTLPLYPVIGDIYTSTATANTWTSGHTYQWSGTAWTDVTATPAPACLPQVSMVCCPSALNGKRMRVTVFVKVLHTLAIS